jgi:hypothetical protein
MHRVLARKEVASVLSADLPEILANKRPAWGSQIQMGSGTMAEEGELDFNSPMFDNQLVEENG